MDIIQSWIDLFTTCLEFFISLWHRVRGRPPPSDGWEAVATDGEEHVEMIESHRR